MVDPELMSTELLSRVALTLLDGVGDITAKNLLAWCGSAEEIFRQKRSHLLKIPGVGPLIADSVMTNGLALKRAEQELRFMEREDILPLFFCDENYPSRLKHCADSPVLLYYKGKADLNSQRIVAVVGTRRPSDYARTKTIELVNELNHAGVVIVSGLAYGVDVLAHKTAMGNDLPTVAVLGHGLDRVYPQTHRRTSERMLTHGGLLSEFPSGTNPDAVNFPKRNRIVAGICDALVVVESARKGGSLITATIANSYNKDVFAFPGRAGEVHTEGCNGLIKQNRAALIENAADLLYAMRWLEEDQASPASRQIPLAIHLNEDEQKIMNAFGQKKSLHLDELCSEIGFPVSKASALLLQLEFNNLVVSRPGKMFEVA